MSGGAFDYVDFTERGFHVSELLRLMAAIFHELDEGVSGDQCLECTKNRTSVSIIKYFECGSGDADAAINIIRDWNQNECPKHKVEIKTP